MRITTLMAGIVALASATSAIATNTPLNDLMQQETGQVTTTKAQPKPGMSLAKKVAVGAAVVGVGGLIILLVKNYKDELSNLFKLPSTPLSETKQPKQPEAYDFTKLDNLYPERLEKLQSVLPNKEAATQRATEIGTILWEGSSALKDALYGGHAFTLHTWYTSFAEKGVNVTVFYREDTVIESLKQAYASTIELYTDLFEQGKTKMASFVFEYSLFLQRLLNQFFYVRGMSLIYKEEGTRSLCRLTEDEEALLSVTMLDGIEELHKALKVDYEIKRLLATNANMEKLKEVSRVRTYKENLKTLLANVPKGNFTDVASNARTFRVTAELLPNDIIPCHNEIVSYLGKLFPNQNFPTQELNPVEEEGSEEEGSEEEESESSSEEENG